MARAPLSAIRTWYSSLKRIRSEDRGPSSSSQISSVRLSVGRAASSAVLEGISNGEGKGMADEPIITIGRGWHGANRKQERVIDGAGRAVSELITQVPIP